MDQLEELTAYHESGHAIAASAAGGRVMRVSIEPEAEGHAGDTRVAWPNQQLSCEDHALREIRVSLAGPVCEMIFAGEYDGLRIRSEHAMDWRTALESAGKIAPHPDKQIALLSREASRLNQYFRDDNNWAAIAELADQLLTHNTVDYETVDDIVRQWMT